MRRIIISLALILLCGFTSAALPAHALGLGDATSNAQKAGAAAGIFTTQSLETIVANLIQQLLALVGVVFFLLSLYAGWTWMTSAGEIEKIKKSKGLILNAAIGLLITLAAYSITYFIARAIEKSIP